MPRLSLAFSPCPNDTFIFDALINNRINHEGIDFDVELSDVEKLNSNAILGVSDITKLSFATFFKVIDDYQLLDAGSALGIGCGPLLISKEHISSSAIDVNPIRIAIPGVNTTANLLLSIFYPEATNKYAVLFSEIESEVEEDRAKAGVIIHENRFTYEKRGLKKIVDLGDLWSGSENLPIPLGGIAIRRSLPEEIKNRANHLIKESISYAFKNPSESIPYVKLHSQNLSDFVIQSHIQLYVNDFSVSLGNQGREAIQMLHEKAQQIGWCKSNSKPLIF